MLEDGTIKIGNFLLNDTQEGDVHYRAPETYLSNIHSSKSDVYQLGCTLHEMVTGKIIFKDGRRVLSKVHNLNCDIIMHRVLFELPCRLSQTYDIRLRHLIWRMLSKNP